MTSYPSTSDTFEAKVLFYEGRGSDEGGESPMPDDERSSVSNRRIETMENTYTISCVFLYSARLRTLGVYMLRDRCLLTSLLLFTCAFI